MLSIISVCIKERKTKKESQRDPEDTEMSCNCKRKFKQHACMWLVCAVA